MMKSCFVVFVSTVGQAPEKQFCFGMTFFDANAFGCVFYFLDVKEGCKKHGRYFLLFQKPQLHRHMNFVKSGSKNE